LGLRIGNGYDAHRLVEGRPLVLGGAVIPYDRGLLGHSDADVLVHAIIDALLGAAGLGDIGQKFPDSSDTYKDISSLILLRQAASSIVTLPGKIINIDSVIVAQKPKLAAFVEQMRKNIADAAQIECDRVNVKATTEEGMGFTGAEQGISAYAVCLLDIGRLR
jgi:2-C-methyl-D-erythritol 2,4-cyclodiphosphate synthase